MKYIKLFNDEKILDTDKACEYCRIIRSNQENYDFRKYYCELGPTYAAYDSIIDEPCTIADSKDCPRFIDISKKGKSGYTY